MNDSRLSLGQILIEISELGKDTDRTLRMAECFDYIDGKNVPNSQCISERMAAKFQICDGTHMPAIVMAISNPVDGIAKFWS